MQAAVPPVYVVPYTNGRLFDPRDAKYTADGAERFACHRPCSDRREADRREADRREAAHRPAGVLLSQSLDVQITRNATKQICLHLLTDAGCLFGKPYTERCG